MTQVQTITFSRDVSLDGGPGSRHMKRRTRRKEGTDFVSLKGFNPIMSKNSVWNTSNCII